MTNDEFIRQIFDELLTNLHSKIRQNSSKLVRVRQNSSPFVKISSKFVKISSKFVKKFVMKSGFTAMNSKICRKKRRFFSQKMTIWVNKVNWGLHLCVRMWWMEKVCRPWGRVGLQPAGPGGRRTRYSRSYFMIYTDLFMLSKSIIDRF